MPAREATRTRRQRARTRLDPEVRREQIVEAAERVFSGRDPAECTFEEIAEAAGVSRALVYNYFRDRGGLLAAVYSRTFERFDAQITDELLSGRGDPSARLRAIVEAYLRFGAENAAVWRLLGSAETTMHPEVDAARRERYQRMADAWGGTPPARMLARAVVGFLEAATLDWIESDDVSAAETVDLLHDVLWNGLARADVAAFGVRPAGVRA